MAQPWSVRWPARAEVVARTPVRHMQVVFVNDGSTDGTQAVADRYPEVIQVRFEENRGYGAAIKAGFQAAQGDLVGFMDADGTCDPCFCVQLINNLLETHADISVGSRMNEASEMPPIRRLGNLMFARLIRTVSGEKLTDSASGMRVLRRSSLRQLHPLPDGLHFTPAMTSLALLDPRMRITEVPMPYKERTGRSKLRVVKDGFKFLFIILFTAALFNPIKSLTLLGALFSLLGLGICVLAGGLGESSLLLGIMGTAFGIVSLQAVFVGFLCHQMLHMLIGPWRLGGFGESLLQRYFWTKRMVRTSVIMLTEGVAGFYVSNLSYACCAWNLFLVTFRRQVEFH